MDNIRSSSNDGLYPIDRTSPSARLSAVNLDPNSPVNIAYWNAWTSINNILAADPNQPNAASTTPGLVGMPGTNTSGDVNFDTFKITKAADFPLTIAAVSIVNFASAYSANPVPGSSFELMNLTINKAMPPSGQTLLQIATSIYSAQGDPQGLIADGGATLGHLASLMHNISLSTAPSPSGSNTPMTQATLQALNTLTVDLAADNPNPNTIMNDLIALTQSMNYSATDGIFNCLSSALSLEHVKGVPISLWAMTLSNPPDVADLTTMMKSIDLSAIFNNINANAEKYS